MPNTTMPVAVLADLPVFPFADEFPFISDEESLELAQDIEQNGLAHPLVLIELPDPETGEVGPFLLDGRNRLRALGRTNLAQVAVQWFEGDRMDALDYVASLNLRRRDLDPGQRAMIAVAYKREAAEAAKLRLSTAGGHSGQVNLPEAKGQARDEAGAKAGVSGSYVDRAEKLINVATDLAEQVKQGALTLNAAMTELKKRQDNAPGSTPGDRAKTDDPHDRFDRLVDSRISGLSDLIAEHSAIMREDERRNLIQALQNLIRQIELA